MFVCCRTWGWKRLRSSPPLSSLWETITASSTHFSFPRNQLQHIFFFNYSTFAIIMFIAVYMVTVITSILVILLSFASSGDGDGETTDAEAMNQLASVVGGFVQVDLTCISLLDLWYFLDFWGFLHFVSFLSEGSLHSKELMTLPAFLLMHSLVYLVYLSVVKKETETESISLWNIQNQMVFTRALR